MGKNYDIYRDSPLRYLGYANEIGEAFRPLVASSVVRASYVVATTYVCADVFDKARKDHAKGADNKRIAITSADVFIWQMLASVVIPGFTINRATHYSYRLLRKARMSQKVVRRVPTIVGLCSIPFIISPIDHFVDYVMEKTFRKWLS